MSDRPPLPAEIVQGGVIAILRGFAPDAAVAMARALADGGIRAMELTFGSPRVEEGIARCAQALQGRAIVGAGTVLTAANADSAVAAGAKFLISPHTDAGLVRRAAAKGIAFLPGAMTPTEVARAWDAGAAAVKLFPASKLGPAYLAALHQAMPRVLLAPTGGVSAGNAAAWRAAGATAVGVGASLGRTGASPAEVSAAATELVAAFNGAQT
jgi:2-dehydro-3-deoxyphosphogluconate aldolase/(4S)-4-hydroxy-2-oxoglutarate aldolase